MTQPAEPSWASLSDGDLLREFVEHGRQTAFAEVMLRHGGMVLAVCRSVLGNTADAEDAAQAVFLTLAQKASSGRTAAPLVGWLHRVAWYVASRAAQGRAIRRRHEQEAARMKQNAAPPGGEEIPLEALHAGLADLPEKYRLPLLLHHLEGRTQEEAAALLGCGLSAVAMRLNRGRQMLRERLIKRGVLATAGMVLAVLGSGAATASASPVFISATVKAATAALAGKVAAAAVSAQTLALSKGALNMLFWAKMKLVAVVTALVLAGGTVGTVLVTQAAGTADPPSVSGTITQVGSGGISIQPDGGQPVAVALNGATVVKVNGQASKAADLKVGMKALVFGQQGQPATEIRSYTPQPPTTHPSPSPAPQPNVAGTITQVGEGSVTIQPGTGQAVVVPLNSATVVKVGGAAAKATDLKVGMRAYAFVPQGQPATEIRAYTPPPATPTPSPAPKPTVAGTITAVGEGSVTIQPGTGQAVVVPLNSATVVQVGGKAAKAADLKVGMRAYTFGQPGQPATEVRAYTPPPATPTPSPAPQPNVAGTITAVGEGSITIQPSTGQAVVVTLNSATVVKVGGQAAAAADLKAGMRAYALGPKGQPATEIRAYTPTTNVSK
jgi:RNA polymerase sigma factor (sigma-70 family)